MLRLAYDHLIYKTVRRNFDAKSAFIAGSVLALTPAAALMFRFNNPDSILTLLLVASAYTMTRAIESSKLRWLIGTGFLLGTAFNAKMLQGLIVVPVYCLVYFIAAKPKWLMRIKDLVFMGISTAVAAFWWPVVVWLTPASSRPYIGSSSTNSIWDLIMGYNGFGRLLGTSSGIGSGAPSGGMGMGAGSGMPSGLGEVANKAVGMAQQMGGGTGGGTGPGGSGFGGSTGIFRMFNSDFGGNIAWFIPLALIIFLAAFWWFYRKPRTDQKRAAFMLWGGWLLLHIAVFNNVSGTIHPYYVVVLAPAVAALVGMGVPYLWRAYLNKKIDAWLLPICIAITSVISFILLNRSTGWMPWLSVTILIGGLAAALVLAVNLFESLGKIARNLAMTVAVVLCAAGPVAYSFATVAVAHNGSVPTAGPTSTALSGSNNESAEAESTLVEYLLANQGSAKWIVAVASANESAPIQISTNQPVMAVGGFNGSDNTLTLEEFKQLVSDGQVLYYATSSSGKGGGGMNGKNDIATWVEENGTIIDYGGSSMTLYKLNV